MECNNWIDIATLLVLILTLIAVIIYTAITGFQASIARDTAYRQLRAYLSTTPLVTEKFPQDVKINIENGGQTPAYRITAHLNRWWGPAGHGIPDGFKYPDLGSTNPQSIAYLNRDKNITFTFPIDRNELEQVRNGETDLFIYGHVNYADIYQKSHSATFFYQYKGKNEADGAISHDFILQRDHNEAD